MMGNIANLMEYTVMSKRISIYTKAECLNYAIRCFSNSDQYRYDKNASEYHMYVWLFYIHWEY